MAFFADLKDRFLSRRRKALSLPPLDAMPWPAVIMDADGAVLAANEAAGHLVQALQAGTLPTLNRDIATAARRNAGTPAEATLTGEEALGASDLTVVPLGQECVLVLARREALDRNLREALVDSRRRYKDLVDVSSYFAWETGPDGVFVFVSPGGALGWQASELVGRRPEDFLVAGEGGEADDAMGDGTDVGSPEFTVKNSFQARYAVQNAEIWFRCADAATACLNVSVRPLYDDDDHWVGARGICRDISEDRERDAQLARAHMRERLFGYIVRTMRDEVEPDNMLAAAAAAIARALAAQGTEIYRVTSGGPQSAVVYGAASPLVPTGCIGASLRRTGTVAVSGEGAAALAVATRYQGEVNGALFL
jgi:PAS domain S-box-containing protein